MVIAASSLLQITRYNNCYYYYKEIIAINHRYHQSVVSKNAQKKKETHSHC